MHVLDTVMAKHLAEIRSYPEFWPRFFKQLHRALTARREITSDERQKKNHRWHPSMDMDDYRPW
jgi:hypothetical protein